MEWTLLNSENSWLFPFKKFSEDDIGRYYANHSSRSTRTLYSSPERHFPNQVSGLPSDARALFAANRLKLPIEFRVTIDGVIIKSICHAEMKDIYYGVYLTFVDDRLVMAKCSCAAGQAGAITCAGSGTLEFFGGCCKHVGALALMLCYYLSRKEYPDYTSCTSKPCWWSVPKPAKGKVVPKVTGFSVLNRKPLEPPSRMVRRRYYDPIKNSEIIDATATALCQWMMEKKLPGSVLIDPAAFLKPQVDENPCIAPKEPISIVFTLPLQFNHGCIDYVDQTINHELGRLKLEHFTFYQSSWLHFSQKDAEDLNSSTMHQSLSDVWREKRRKLVTASKIHYVIRRKKDFTENFMATLINELKSTPQMRQGLNEEGDAIKLYLDLKRTDYPDAQVAKAGLCVSPSFPYIGASPDGVVFSETGMFEAGLVEVKVLTESDKFQWSQIPDRMDLTIDDLLSAYYRTKKSVCSSFSFYLQKRQSGWKLKKTHQYYSQVLTQMAVTGIRYCDFVVKADEKVFIERIDFAESEFFSDKFFGAVTQFYFQHFLPFLYSKYANDAIEAE